MVVSTGRKYAKEVLHNQAEAGPFSVFAEQIGYLHLPMSLVAFHIVDSFGVVQHGSSTNTILILQRHSRVG